MTTNIILMAKTGSTSKELFTALGEVKLVEGKHRFVPSSIHYIDDQFSRIPIGKKISCVFYDKVPMRSQSQLAYHFILMGYLATYTGDTQEELHDAVMRLKFGEKVVKLGNKQIRVRKSISDRARMSKSDCVELISFDLALCMDLNVKVPTFAELGYLVDEKGRIIR